MVQMVRERGRTIKSVAQEIGVGERTLSRAEQLRPDGAGERAESTSAHREAAHTGLSSPPCWRVSLLAGCS